MQPGASVPIDGKIIKASMEEYDSAYQNFVAIVSAFCTQPGVVVGLQARRNGNGSEISTVQTLLNVLYVQLPFSDHSAFLAAVLTLS